MIRLSRLVKTFKRVRVLDGVDLVVGPGERVALIGSNGAGKTTLIRCLLGEYAFTGQVEVMGVEPRQNRTTVLKQIGFVPQLPPPLKMPVGQLIDFSAALCGTDPARIAAVAERLALDMDAVRVRPFIRLSGGMKQKLLIAIALGRDARLLIMDEPAANLDPAARKVFFELLAERLRDVTMLISSHRLDEISPLVNRVVEMDMGRIVLDDVVADDGALTGILICRITLRRFEPAFAKAIEAWSLTADESRQLWQGRIASADRLRFLGVVSRYAALLAHLSLREESDDPNVAP